MQKALDFTMPAKKILDAHMNNVVTSFIDSGLVDSSVQVIVKGKWWLMSLVPYVVLAPRVLSEDVKLGVVSQVVWIFDILNHALSFPLNHMSDITTVQNTLKRIYNLAKICDKFNKTSHKSQIDRKEVDDVQVSNLTYEMPPPKRTVLGKDLSFRLVTNSSILIVGDSGCGKSSLLKTLAGLWSHGKGNITLPKKDSMMFLPQKPYMPLFPDEQNTLKAQLLFPWCKKSSALVSDMELISVLEKVNLGHILSRFPRGIYSTARWHRVLSHGEQQRLAFARVLLAQPKIVFLDESTSAMDEDNEKRMYSLLKEKSMWFISIGHRKNLSDWHDRILHIENGTGWRFISHEEYRS